MSLVGYRGGVHATWSHGGQGLLWGEGVLPVTLFGRFWTWSWASCGPSPLISSAASVMQRL